MIAIHWHEGKYKVCWKLEEGPHTDFEGGGKSPDISCYA